MNPVDAGVMLILGLGAVRGYIRGILRESFGVIGLVAGIVAGLALSPQLGDELVARGLLRPVEAPLVAAPLLFCGVYLAATLLGLLANRLAKTLFLGGVDRAGGIAFGLARGVAVCGLLLALAAHILPKDYLQFVEGSRSGKWLTGLGMTIVDTGRRFAPTAPGRSI
jgi:membrane protein required for colicin V production